MLLLNKLNKLNNINMYCIKYRNNSTYFDLRNELSKLNNKLNDYILLKKEQHKDIMELENKKYQLNALNSLLSNNLDSYNRLQCYKKILEIVKVD